MELHETAEHRWHRERDRSRRRWGWAGYLAVPVGIGLWIWGDGSLGGLLLLLLILFLLGRLARAVSRPFDPHSYSRREDEDADEAPDYSLAERIPDVEQDR